jgi:hypothetical protein
MERFELDNPQGGFSQSEPEVLHGRQAIPVEAALLAQKTLIEYMVKYMEVEKPIIWSALSDDERDQLSLMWMEKYVLGDFNGFAEYCDIHAEDIDYIDRVKKGELTGEDLESMREFLERSPKGSPFKVTHH